MARRQPQNPDQYALDFESSHNERFGLLVGAIEVMGLNKFKPLALIVFNAIEASPSREPCGFKICEYAEKLGVSSNTARAYRDQLAAVGILSIESRTYVRGGTMTSLVSINWMNVRTFAFNRLDALGRSGKLDRPPNFGGRAPDSGGRPPNSGAPLKEYHSFHHSSESNTSTTTALPHARIQTNEEEDIFLKKLVAECRRMRIPMPSRFLPAVKAAIESGLTFEQIWKRCQWFHANQVRWAVPHRPGVLHDGLAEAQPDMPENDGWPYQR